ncbi:unnamed protein product [Prorocentrum cordatum]|uniref:Uncharacterized protein n=1 Tax=Prorocentrum cordatum TaxID=2364126 RepID=A0ABN9VY57_9DINO|nr:unnamed protein product [Polarella glacialis]
MPLKHRAEVQDWNSGGAVGRPRAAISYFVDDATDKVSSATDKVSRATDKVSDATDEASIATDKVSDATGEIGIETHRVYNYLSEDINIIHFKGSTAVDQAGLNINAAGKSYLWLQGRDSSAKRIDDIKLEIDGDLRRYNPFKAIMARLAKQSLAQNNPEQCEGYWIDSDDENYWEYYGYYDDYGQWHDYDDEDDWWDYSHDQEYDDNGYSPPALNSDEAHKGSGKGKKNNPGNRSKCVSRRHKTEDCPAGSKKKTNNKGDNNGKGKGRSDSNSGNNGENNGTGKYRSGKCRGKSKGRGKGSIEDEAKVRVRRARVTTASTRNMITTMNGTALMAVGIQKELRIIRTRRGQP